jgi:hypothetical protein
MFLFLDFFYEYRQAVETQVMVVRREVVKLTDGTEYKTRRPLVPVRKGMILDEKIQIGDSFFFSRRIWLDTEIGTRDSGDQRLNLVLSFFGQRKRNEAFLME